MKKQIKFCAPSSDEVTSRETDKLNKPRLLRETDEDWSSFKNSSTKHHLKTFTSASAFPNATLPSTPSLDDVTCRELDDLDKPRLLHEADEKWI